MELHADEAGRSRLRPLGNDMRAESGQRVTTPADDIYDVRRHTAGQSENQHLHRRGPCVAVAVHDGGNACAGRIETQRLGPDEVSNDWGLRHTREIVDSPPRVGAPHDGRGLGVGEEDRRGTASVDGYRPDVRAAYRRACRMADGVEDMPIIEPFDLVVDVLGLRQLAHRHRRQIDNSGLPPGVESGSEPLLERDVLLVWG